MLVRGPFVYQTARRCIDDTVLGKACFHLARLGHLSSEMCERAQKTCVKISSSSACAMCHQALQLVGCLVDRRVISLRP